MKTAARITYQARLEPERLAIVVGETSVTFGMLEAAVQSSCRALAAIGLPPGSVVAIGVKAPHQHIALSLALARLGLVSAPFSSKAQFDVLPQPALILTDGSTVTPDGRYAIGVDAAWFAPSDGPPLRLPKPPAPDAECRIFTSSGSTGVPKPVRQTHAGLETRFENTGVTFDLVGVRARPLCLMPPSSAWGYSNAMAALGRGMTIHFASGSEEALSTAARHGCDYLLCSVQQVIGMIRRQQLLPTPLPSLVGIALSGSAITHEVVRSAQALLTRRILLMYSSTETGLNALEIAGFQPWQDGATGLVTPWTRIEVVDEARQPLPRGTEGELRLRASGQANFGGGPEADGGPPWFYPGDRGLVSREGRLTITGRTDNLINVGGAKLASERVEEILMRHPAVRDAGVVAFRTAEGVDAIRAGIVKDGEVSEDAIRAFVRDILVPAVPREIVFVDAIPRGGDADKILRPALRALLG